MGPTCEVLLEVAPKADTLRTIDTFLATAAERIERTRKGRHWRLWIRERPFQISVVDFPPGIALSAGCNSQEDYAALEQIGSGLAALLGGLATEPIK